jgi:hypothetical protein
MKLNIDDSEFPFLIGVVCANNDDLEKLKKQLHEMEGYNFSGGVSDNTTYVMNLVPPSEFPAEAHQRISRRMTVRERMLYDKIHPKR